MRPPRPGQLAETMKAAAGRRSLSSSSSSLLTSKCSGCTNSTTVLRLFSRTSATKSASRMQRATSAAAGGAAALVADRTSGTNIAVRSNGSSYLCGSHRLDTSRQFSSGSSSSNGGGRDGPVGASRQEKEHRRQRRRQRQQQQGQQWDTSTPRISSPRAQISRTDGHRRPSPNGRKLPTNNDDRAGAGSILREVEKILERHRKQQQEERNKSVRGENNARKMAKMSPFEFSPTKTSEDDAKRPGTETDSPSSWLRSGGSLASIPPPSASDRNLLDIFKLDGDDSDDNDCRGRRPRDDDAEARLQYLALVDEVASDEKFQKRHTSKPIGDELARPVTDWLRRCPSSYPGDGDAEDSGAAPSNPITSLLHHILETGVPPNNVSSLRSAVEQQQDRFKTEMNWDARQYNMAQGAIYQISNLSAKRSRGLPIRVVWEKVKEVGLIDKNTLQTLLYVSTTMPSTRRRNARYARLAGAGASTILDVLEAVDNASPDSDGSGDRDEEIHDITDEIAIYNDLIFKPTEQTISIRVRLLVSQGKGSEAEELLNEHAESLDLRLRAYIPVLRLYLEEGDLSSAVRIYRKMIEAPQVWLDVDTHVSVLAGLAENGYFRPSGGPSIDSAKAMGFSCGSGSGLLDDIVSEMAKDALEIPMMAAKKLYNAFAAGFPDSGLEKTSALSPLKVVSDAASAGDLIVDRVMVDPETGRCPRSGVKLRLITLEDSERERLKETIITAAKSRQLEFIDADASKRKKRANKGRADAALMQFTRWLDEREGQPFTAIIDGANIGYYLQNFDNGRFSFHQIQFVAEILESYGESVLVVLPSKYTRNEFYVTIGAGGSSGPRKQVLTREEANICDTLIKEGKICIVPPGFLDDYYWILGSVSQQTKSRNGKDLNVETGNAEGRWPGARPIVISNDLMRDHRLEMLEPRLFRRWYSNVMVNYNFTGFVDGECPSAEIGFHSPDFFSREIQGNEGPGESMVWHFPIAETEDNWFCLRIPRQVGKD